MGGAFGSKMGEGQGEEALQTTAFTALGIIDRTAQRRADSAGQERQWKSKP